MILGRFRRIWGHVGGTEGDFEVIWDHVGGSETMLG